MDQPSEWMQAAEAFVYAVRELKAIGLPTLAGIVLAALIWKRGWPWQKAGR